MWEQSAQIAPTPLMLSETALTSTIGYAGSDFPAVIAALRRGGLDAAPSSTARIPLDRAVEEGCEGQVKGLVHPCWRPAAVRPGKQSLAT
ncbi:hypothetical protein ACFU8W_43985 [Streptomyces sp. NPDC057565]|uniref:hypothetical protein n=1 Tax=Streptomyces sp. NPDC057565 TaxID=3346169 RepID=UPI0036CE37E4